MDDSIVYTKQAWNSSINQYINPILDHLRLPRSAQGAAVGALDMILIMQIPTISAIAHPLPACKACHSSIICQCMMLAFSYLQSISDPSAKLLESGAQAEASRSYSNHCICKALAMRSGRQSPPTTCCHKLKLKASQSQIRILAHTEPWAHA